MKSEAEIRELHARLANVLRYAKSIRVPIGQLRELIQAKIELEYVLDMRTASANGWQASVFKAITNLESLQKTQQRSAEAFNN